MEFCDRCGEFITEKWNGFSVEDNGDIACNKCLEKEDDSSLRNK